MRDMDGIALIRIISSLFSLGVSAPNMPQNVGASQISQDSATIQWTVPSIAYTPETYVVEYGAGINVFGGSSRNDVEAVNKTYNVTLKNLTPGTNYTYAIIAQNYFSQSTSKTISSFTTNTTGETTYFSSCFLKFCFI